MEKLKLTGVPEKAVYFVATGDKAMDAVQEGATSGSGGAADAKGGQSGGSHNASVASPFRASLLEMSEGEGLEEVDELAEDQELISEKLLKRLGPMQLTVMQDYITHGQCLSWKNAPLALHRRHMRRHLQYLTYHKPSRQIDSNNFRCSGCRREFTLAEIKDFLAIGGNELNRGAALCQSCSCGHCAECGEQISLALGAQRQSCAGCGADVVSVAALIPAHDLEAEREVSRSIRSSTTAVDQFVVQPPQ
jgi:hypothetical protein